MLFLPTLKHLLLWGGLVHSGSALLAAPATEPAPSLRLSGALAAETWVQVLPSDFKAQARTFEVDTDQRSVVLEGVPPGFALIFVGGKERATSFQFLDLGASSPTTFPELTPGVRVTGSVARGRKPVAGAEVGLVPHPVSLRRLFTFPLARQRGELVFTVKSSDQGRYTLPHVAPGTYLLDVRFPGGRRLQSEPFTVPAPESLRDRETPAPGEDRKPPTFDLGETAISEGLDLTVTAVDTAGRPIPQAVVAASQGDRLSGKTQSFEVAANAAGTATLSGLAPGEGVTVFCRAPGFGRSEQTFGGVPPTARCVLERHTRLAGRVFDLDDKPLADAQVSVKPHRSTRATDKEGRFNLPGLNPGSYVLTVAAPGFRSFTIRFKLAAEQKLELPPIRLERAEGFLGRVIDGTTGEPVAGAMVTIDDPPGAGSAMTDAEGIFSLTADAAGDLEISIASSAYPEETFTVSPEDRQNRTEPPTFELFPGGRIQVTAWDEKADSPCSGCDVSLQWLNPQRVKLFKITTNQNGEGISEALPPGRYNAYIEKVVSTGTGIHVGGGGGYSQDTQVFPGKTSPVRLGEPRPLFEVSFDPPPSPDMFLGWDDGSEVGGAQLDVDGVYRTRKRAGSGVQLSLHAGRPGVLEVLQATLPEGYDRPYLRLPLAQTRMSGRLTREGAPVALQKIEIVSRERGATLARGGADPEGLFSAAYLPPGTYDLLVNGRLLQTFPLFEGQPLDLGTLEIPVPAAQ